MNLRPYSPESTCDKCGDIGALTKFTAGTDGIEFMSRTCQRCGFEWNESCLDAKPEPKARVMLEEEPYGRP